MELSTFSPEFTVVRNRDCLWAYLVSAVDKTGLTKPIKLTKMYYFLVTKEMAVLGCASTSTSVQRQQICVKLTPTVWILMAHTAVSVCLATETNSEHVSILMSAQ